jgi:hypothetical protein
MKVVGGDDFNAFYAFIANSKNRAHAGVLRQARTSLRAGSSFTKSSQVRGRRLKTNALITGLKGAECRTCLSKPVQRLISARGSIPIRLRYQEYRRADTGLVTAPAVS